LRTGRSPAKFRFFSSYDLFYMFALNYDWFPKHNSSFHGIEENSTTSLTGSF
jgi:hypothetical protein